MGTASTLRTPGAYARLAVLRSIALRSIVVLVAGGLFAFGVAFAWWAFTDPLEIEIREGSVWIQVLAKRAGIDIYDPAQVVFINMNHGPFDTILKTWVSMALPALPGYMVTRCFVLLTPFVLLWAGYVISRRSLPGALMAASGLYLLLLHVSRMILVGRTDATALCGVAVCGLLTHQLLVNPSKNWSSRSYIAWQAGLGAVSAVVFLVSWRYFPVPAALQFVALVKQISEPRRALPRGLSRLRRVLIWVERTLYRTAVSTGCFLAGFAAVWLPTFWIELGGDGPSYYRHFFGFFKAESGWGAIQGATFQLLPRALWGNRTEAVVVFALVILLALFRLRHRPLQLGAWFVMLVALWVTVCYGYYKNEGGGGLHYFYEFFVFAWIFVLHALCQRKRRGARAEWALLVLVSLVAGGVPWGDLVLYYERVVDIRERAIAFREEVAVRTAGEVVFGEETHLFKDRYRGEVVDTGDTTERVVQSGYFGRQFTETYRQYTKDLIRNPPRFVLVGLLNEAAVSGVMTPTLRNLLRTHYTRVASIPDNCYSYGGGQALYELKAPRGLGRKKEQRRSAPHRGR